MKSINGFEFPASPADTEKWKPTVVRIALHRNVLVVAHTRIEGAWAAYCGPVLGNNHEEEYHNVLREGDKISENLARVMFPIFEGLPYAQ